MKKSQLMIIAGSVLCFAATPALAQITFESQLRRVSANTSGPSESFQTTDLGLFDVEASAEFSEQSASAFARQTSFLSSNEISGDGFASGGALNAFSAGGSSTMNIAFQVAAPTEYSFTGTVPLSSGFQGAAWVILRGPNDFVTGMRTIGDDEESFDFIGSINEIGVLQPGAYTLEAVAQSVDLGFADEIGDFEFSITFVPAPGSAALMVACGLLGTRRRRA